MSALDRVDWSDDLSYVREMYRVPARVGGRIVLNGMTGVIEKGAGAHLRVRIDSHPEWGAIWAHPTWRMEYLNAVPVCEVLGGQTGEAE